jgi:hypothetical protein
LILESGESGVFQSLLPEDSIEYLLQYISLTRLHEKNIAESFRQHVDKLDANVHLSFASSFKYLSEIYVDALKAKDWTSTDPRTQQQGEVHSFFIIIDIIAFLACLYSRLEDSFCNTSHCNVF